MRFIVKIISFILAIFVCVSTVSVFLDFCMTNAVVLGKDFYTTIINRNKNIENVYYDDVFVVINAASIELSSNESVKVTIDIFDKMNEKYSTEKLKTLFDDSVIKVRDSKSGSVIKLSVDNNCNIDVNALKNGTSYIIIDVETFHFEIPVKVSNNATFIEENEIVGNAKIKTSTNRFVLVAPFISQLPKYPTGCESIAALMALHNLGFSITADSFIDDFLDKTASLVDPNKAFGGDPRSRRGSGCYAPVIKTAIDRIVKNQGYEAKNLTGMSLDMLCAKYIDYNIPVIVWGTLNFSDKFRTTTHNGIKWTSLEHCLLLVGYDDDHYIFHDPMKKKGYTPYRKSAVNIGYNALDKMAVVIVKSD